VGPLVALLRLLEPGAGLAEARWCLAERRVPPRLDLPPALQEALGRARAQWRAQALALADAALWAAASRCQRGWEHHVGWARLDAVLTPEEREAASVVGTKGRTLCTAWAQAKRRAR
jgi:hypothetical protein